MVIHLGCGLDSRYLRVKQKYFAWYDIDYNNVIDIRKDYYLENEKYRMIGKSVMDFSWMDEIIKCKNVLIVAEGLMMYLSYDEIKNLILHLDRFENVYLIFDAYTNTGVKYSKIKNPINQMKAKIKYGFDTPKEFLSLNDRLRFVDFHYIRKTDNSLHGIEKFVFNNIYCGKISQSLYRIYEFELND